MNDPLKILIVATKPPWPPVDGGRVVVFETLNALSSAGHSVTLVTPVDPIADIPGTRAELAKYCTPELVPARPRSASAGMAVSLLSGRPVTIVRHQLPEIRRRVAELVAADRFDVVQAEQLQAVAQTEPAQRRSIPVVYRAHNVESTLWSYAASFGQPLTSAALRREARRLVEWEGRVLRRVTATVALTEIDVDPLRRAAGDQSPIHVIPVPFQTELTTGEVPLAGDPAVVTLASPTWLPSRETVRLIASVWWPEVRRQLPDATLHVFGGVSAEDRDGVQWHGAPGDSVEAFAAGAVMAIPTRHPTGVPVKALEAWARGVPLVVSSETAAALGTTDGEGVAVADGPAALAAALARIQQEPHFRQKLVDGGRSLLASRHDPVRIAAALAELYREIGGSQ